MGYFKHLAVGWALVVFLWSTNSYASISFAFQSPTSNPVGLSLSVSVTVTSTYDLQTVHAQVGTIGGDLAPGPSSGAPWTGTLPMESVSRGQQTLAVQATDVLGNTASGSVIFTHDNPPVITVTSPMFGETAIPNAKLSATCTDDDSATGCIGFSASWSFPSDYESLATGVDSIDTTVSLASHGGEQGAVVFLAKDSAGQTTVVSQRVFVSVDETLAPFFSAPGEIWDFDGTRALYKTRGGSVVLRGNGTDTVLGTALDGSGLSSRHAGGSLTSSGAAWGSLLDTDAMQGFEWHDGTATKFCDGFLGGYDDLVHGDYAFLSVNAGKVLRNVAQGTQGQVSFPTFTDGHGTVGIVRETSLAPNGDLLGFAEDPSTPVVSCPVLRYRAGIISTIGHALSCDGQNLPISDGVNVVYNVNVTGGSQLAVMNATGTETLFGKVHAGPGATFAAYGGWVAFLDRSATNVVQVWTRSPSGTIAQVTPFGADSVIETLNDQGEVMFFSAGIRYLGRAGIPPQLISVAAGRAVWRCGGWYVLLGNRVFRPTDVADAGTGCPVPVGGSASDGDAGAVGTESDAGALGSGGDAGALGSGGDAGALGSGGGAGALGSGGGPALGSGGSGGTSNSSGSGGSETDAGTGSPSVAAAATSPSSGGCAIGKRAKGGAVERLAALVLLTLVRRRKRHS